MELPITVVDTAGNAVSGASGTVTKRIDASTATIYTTEAGATTTANPLTSDSSGRFNGWVDANLRYDVAITATGLTSYTEQFDAVSGDTGVRVAYTPTWSSTGTQPAINNGTLVGAYHRVGDVVFFTISLVWGSGTSAGTGVYNLTLPVTAATISGARWTGQLFLLDSGTQAYNGWWTIASAGTTFENIQWSSTAQTGTAVQASGAPITYAAGDQIVLTGFYAVA